MENTLKENNILTLQGLTFKTGGNIVFDESEGNTYYLAESSTLENYHEALENGLQSFLKKIKL